jgi:hypothetical protein
MRFPLTAELLEEADRYRLRSACCDCFFHVERERRCAHEWPNESQRRWPLDAPDAAGRRPEVASFCKEFELR